MCGVYGYFDRKGRGMPQPVVDQMAVSLVHRGPDGRGEDHRGACAVGNMRLAIIDVEGGDQPFFSDDGSVSVVQNGEIYNYVELRQELAAAGVAFRTHSDTEVLLQLYLRHGAGFLDKLSGMFAIAVADRRTGTMLVARDPIGVKPLFLYDDGDRLLFASEIKSLLRAGVPRRMDDEALHHYLSYGYVPAPWTLFQGVRHLMPGCLIEVSSTKTEIRRWWDLTRQEQRAWSIEEFKETFTALLSRSVEIRMRADVPFGAFLSGGLDSSTVVGLMGRYTDKPVRTFSIGFHDERFDESEYARQASERFGTDHTLDFVGPEIVADWAKAVYHCDQPHSDVSFLPTMRLSHLAVQHVKMVLTGDGGDELFGGYEKYTDFFSRDVSGQDDQAFSDSYHDHISLFTEDLKRSLYSATQRRVASDWDTRTVTREAVAQVPHWDRRNQAMWLDVSLLLPGNNLVKPDRMAMAVSLEAREPFLDRALTEFAFQVPGSLKLQGNVTRWAYKETVRDLLGPELTDRKKRMFTVPIGEWFKDSLRPLTWALLTEGPFLDRGVFDQETVQQVLERHEQGSANHTREIRQLVAFELWCRTFLDADGSAPVQVSELSERVATG